MEARSKRRSAREKAAMMSAAWMHKADEVMALMRQGAAPSSIDEWLGMPEGAARAVTVARWADDRKGKE